MPVRWLVPVSKLTSTKPAVKAPQSDSGYALYDRTVKKLSVALDLASLLSSYITFIVFCFTVPSWLGMISYFCAFYFARFCYNKLMTSAKW